MISCANALPPKMNSINNEKKTVTSSYDSHILPSLYFILPSLLPVLRSNSIYSFQMSSKLPRLPKYSPPNVFTHTERAKAFKQLHSGNVILPIYLLFAIHNLSLLHSLYYIKRGSVIRRLCCLNFRT